MDDFALTPQEVDFCLREHLEATPPISCHIDSAIGRFLREPIVTDRDLPPYDRAMMDGYALRSSDAPGGKLTVQGRQLAGEPPIVLSRQAGNVIEVMTGSSLPVGADCVVPYEWTRREGDIVHLSQSQAYAPGQYIHQQGEDCRAGSTQVSVGVWISPIEIAMAASCGYDCLSVSQHPRITVFSTGDELVPIAAEPKPHQIRRSNSYAMAAALKQAGFSCQDVLHLGDDLGVSKNMLEDSLEQNDVVVLSGGISKGVMDWIPGVLDGVGERLFHRVAQRPGRPMGAWKAHGGCLVFALPGNPVSSLVGLYRYVLPYVKACESGRYDTVFPKVVLAQDVQPLCDKALFLPIVIDHRKRAVPKPTNNSGDFTGLLGTTGFVMLDKGVETVKAGSSVSYLPWNP